MDLKRLKRQVALADVRNVVAAPDLRITRVPLVLECDDLSLLKALALGSDTVIGSTDVGTVQDVQAGQLVRLDVVDILPLFSDMAIVSLKGRSYSLMAQFAVDFIVRQAQAISMPVQANVPI